MQLLDWADVSSHDAASPSASTANFQAEASFAANDRFDRSANVSSSSPAPLTPHAISTSDFLQHFHIQLTPNSLATHYQQSAASPLNNSVQRHNGASFGTTAGKKSVAFALRLPLPFSGEHGDLDC